MLDKLKAFNWKRNFNTLFKVLIDFKVIGLLALAAFTIYGIGWETVIRPSMEGLQSKDKFIKEQKDSMVKRQQLQHQYGALEDKLKNLDIHLITFHQGTSSKIVSVTEAAALTELAMGKNRPDNLPPLPPPHNLRETINLKLIDSAPFDILNVTGEAAPAAATTPEASKTDPAASPIDQSQITSLPVDRYNYDLSVSGTYPALIDLLNQLVISKKLFKINKITISKPTTATPQDIPDAKEYPDFPVKLDMVVSLSLFLYEDNTPPAAAAPPSQ